MHAWGLRCAGHCGVDTAEPLESTVKTIALPDLASHKQYCTVIAVRRAVDVSGVPKPLWMTVRRVAFMSGRS